MWRNLPKSCSAAHSDTGIGAEHVYTCAEGSLSYAYFFNPVGLAGMYSCVTATKSCLQTGPWEKGEKGGEKRFWVIYSGGSRLNQGMTTVWLTYFDSSPCFGIFSSSVFLLLWLPGFFPLCSVNETGREKCGLLLKLEKCPMWNKGCRLY